MSGEIRPRRRKRELPVDDDGPMMVPRVVPRPGKPKPKPIFNEETIKAFSREITAPPGWFDAPEPGIFGVDPANTSGTLYAVRLPPVQRRPSPDRRKKKAVKKPKESKRERRERKIKEATAEPPVVFEVKAEDIKPGDLVIGMPGGRRVSKVVVRNGCATIHHKGRPAMEAISLRSGSLWLVRRDG